MKSFEENRVKKKKKEKNIRIMYGIFKAFPWRGNSYLLSIKIKTQI